MKNFEKAQRHFEQNRDFEAADIPDQNYDANGDPIGCDSNGKCNATCKDQCWRFSKNIIGTCEYKENKECWNCFIRVELCLPE